MTCRRHPKIKLAGVLVAVLMLAALLFSAYFIARHADHHCTGEDCPVCIIMHQCESILRGFGRIGAGSGLLLCLLPILTRVSVMTAGCRREDTPVSIKVRLND